MPRSLASNTKSYTKNLFIRVKRVLTRAETAAEAVEGLKQDTKKLSRRILTPGKVEARAKAIELVRKGRSAYNLREYEEAEEYFRSAVAEDGRYAVAHLHLGTTLYRLGRAKDAVASWRRAIKSDPQSEDAKKAQQKIAHYAKSTNEVLDELHQRTRK